MSPLVAGADSTSLVTLALQRRSPLSASRAITSPFSVPTSTSPCPAPTPPETGSLSLVFHNSLPVWRSMACTRPSASAAKMRSPSTAGVRRLNRSPWPSPIERLHSLRSVSSASKSGRSAGGSSFLLELPQPASTAMPNSSAQVQGVLTSGVSVGQVVQLELQGAGGTVDRQRVLGLAVGGERLLLAAQLQQQVAAHFLAAGQVGGVRLALQQGQAFLGLVLGAQHAGQALTGQLFQVLAGRLVQHGAQLG